MKIFVVTDYDRWGYSLNVVRAHDADDARKLVSPRSRPDFVLVEPLDQIAEGNGPAILWTKDESPDTPRRDD